MKFSISVVSAFLAAAAVAAPIPVELEKRGAPMCAKFGSVHAAGFTVYHNNWGAGKAASGSQCTTFNSVSSAGSVSWSTSWSWPGNPQDVKSYSNVALEKVNKQISAISSIPTTWSWKQTGTNVISDVAYDLWLAPSVGARNQYEVMVWLGSFGGAGPISSTYNGSNAAPIASASISGTTWKLFKGTNGGATVFSFVGPSSIGNFKGDLKLFLNYLTSSQGVSPSAVVTSLQAGTEPFTGSNVVFTTSAYTIKVI